MRPLLLLPLFLLSGCMALYQPPWAPAPVVDTGDAAKDCRAHADRDQPVTEGMQGVAIGAGTGAALGAVISGFAFGGPIGAAAGWGALAGGVAGGALGAANGMAERDAALAACPGEHTAKAAVPGG